MTREEAIEVLKKKVEYLESDKRFKAAVETLIPELKESEDEKIRKWLIDYFKAVGKSWIHRDISPEQIIDWLEKQKEQKPADYDHEMWKNCEANFEGGKKEVIDHPEKYGLQKPAEWSEEDIDKMVNKKARKSGTTKTEMQFYRQGIEDTLKSLRPSWKPSEDDIKMLEHIIGQYETGNKNSKVMGYLPKIEELNFLKKVLAKWKNLL